MMASHQFDIKRDAVVGGVADVDEAEFGDAPATCVCPHCTKRVVTAVEFRTSWVTILLCFLVFLILGWLSFCVLPFLFPLFQDCCHFCPQCLNTIVRKKRIRLPKISQEVLTIRCGTCAIVLSRKYVILFMVMATLILMANLFRWFILRVGLPDIPKGPHIDKTWLEFIGDCGLRTYLGNPIHASTFFSSTYYRNTVTWSGRVNKIQEGIFSKNFVYVNMDPSQFPPSLAFRNAPDLALMFGKVLDEKVADVHPEDQIEFEATLLELGRRGRPHLGMLWDLNITAKHDELPPLHQPRVLFGGGGQPMGLFDIAREMGRIQPRVHFIRVTRIIDDDDDDDDEGGEGDEDGPRRIAGGEQRVPRRAEQVDGEAEIPLMMRMILGDMFGAGGGDDDDDDGDDDHDGDVEHKVESAHQDRAGRRGGYVEDLDEPEEGRRQVFVEREPAVPAAASGGGHGAAEAVGVVHQESLGGGSGVAAVGGEAAAPPAAAVEQQPEFGGGGFEGGAVGGAV